MGNNVKMDFNLAALKLLCVQLKSAAQTTSQSSFTLGGLLFQRAWLQGVIISTPSFSDEDGGDDDDDTSCKFVLDDGTGLIELVLSTDFLSRHWEIGMYVMVVGAYSVRDGDLPMLKVHKMVDLSPFPDRESMWYLEVIEAFKLFYQPLFEQ